MKRTALILAALFSWSFPAPAVRGDAAVRVAAARRLFTASARAARADELIVQFQAGADERDTARVIWEAGGARAQRSAFGRRFRVTLDAGFTVEEALRRLRQMPEVAYAQPNYLLRATQVRNGRFTPNDRLFEAQWNFRLLDAERTWGIQDGDPAVAVAVIDTGVAYENFGPFRKAPDWGDTVFLPGFDFVNRDSHPNDDDGHGTHVASTIAEGTNNSLGVAGLAFRCALLPVKVLDHDGSGSVFDIAEGIDFAINFTQDGRKPVKVINMSLGGDDPGPVVRSALDRATAAGITVVASSGNDEKSSVEFPAAFPNVIAVGAVDARKVRAPYSNYGRELDLVAPGGNFDRDDDNDDFPDGILQQTFDPDEADRGRYDDFAYWYFQGTSMATAHVSAAAALLYQQGITSPAAVQAALERSAEDLGPSGRDDQHGHGLIRPVEALKGLGLNR